MSIHPTKKHPTLGCCGLDCGLCPRYYTVGSSRCPGCCGPDFFNKHPSCSYITCCVKKKGFEVCSQCDEFPCRKFDSWLHRDNVPDSYPPDRAVHSNHRLIKERGLEEFLKTQKMRMRSLEKMLQEFNDGRSKSFYCHAANLLPIEDLQATLNNAEQRIRDNKIKSDDVKTKSGMLRELLTDLALKKGIELESGKKVKASKPI